MKLSFNRERKGIKSDLYQIELFLLNKEYRDIYTIVEASKYSVQVLKIG